MPDRKAISIFYLRKFFTKQTFSKPQISEDDISDILKFQNELMTQLKELAQKTSAEGLLLSDRLPVLENRCFIQLQDRCASFRDEILAILEQDHAKTAKKFERLEKIIEDFGRKSAFFRDSLERVTRYEELYENQMNRHLVKISPYAKEEGFGEVINESSLEAFHNEYTNSILIAIKDCMDQIINELKWNEGNSILEISTFVKQHYKNLKELLSFIINENLEKLRQHPIDMLMVQTEGIEKQFLEVCIFLNRKLVDVQAIEETLKFFNRKFSNFADKCETKWDHSCSSFDDTRDFVYEAEDNLIISSNKISRISYFLTQQTADIGKLTRALEDAGPSAIAVTETRALGQPSNKRMEQVFLVVENMKETLETIEEDYRLQLRAMSESLETPSQRLESFVQYVEDLEFMNDLVRNIANKYENMTTCTSTCGHCNNNNHADDEKGIETLSMISGDGMSSCLVGGNFSEFSFEVNQSKNDEYNLPKKANGKETRRHVTLRRMMSVLDDVLRKTAVAQVEKDGGSSEGKFSSKRDIEDKPKKKMYNWSSIPSEISLSEINYDGLVRNSSSEDEQECYM